MSEPTDIEVLQDQLDTLSIRLHRLEKQGTAWKELIISLENLLIVLDAHD